jgi:exonuclease VII large subunit
MSDIITRLRAVPPQRTDANNRMLCLEAADEIERLRAYQNETAKAWTKLTESQEQEIEHLQNEVKKWQVLASQGIQIERELRATIASGKLDPAQVWPS